MRYIFIIIITVFPLFVNAQDIKEDLKYYESGKLKARRIHTENHEKCEYIYFHENGNIKTMGFNFEYKNHGFQF
ncbi:hypothetical protein [Mariniflexile sp.]|uniref:hypothetical protein n=1 Tax=Mariniflexile sp. TaxID=1979402 RepID=UPI004048E6F1